MQRHKLERALDTWLYWVGILAWMAAHPRTVEGIIADYENRQWQRILGDLELEDTPENRAAVSEWLPKVLEALRGELETDELQRS